MPTPEIPRPPLTKRLLNKSFYRFLFSFVAVVTGVLLFILLLGVGGGAV